MKIKIGDVPLRIYNKICKPGCKGCPFAIQIDDVIFPCKGVKSEYQDKIIDIPDELFNKGEKSEVHFAPTADVAPVVHAHWGREKCVAYQRKGCSRCGSVMPLKKNKKGYALIWYSNYCPNCGAKMDKEKKEND